MNSNIAPLVEKFDDITDRVTNIYCIDIDGTLTEPHEGTPWEAEPVTSRIDKVNKLYFGKPRAVTYVDDRAMSDHEFFGD